MAIAKQRDGGFSLVELILVIIILSTIAAVGSQMLSSGFNAYFSGRDLIDAEWQGRYAMQRISRELRDVRSATSGDLVMSSSQITFTDNSANVITYALSGNTLTRNTLPLADGVTSLSFYYIQADGSTTATSAADVMYISVDIAVNLNNSSYSLRNTLHPRRF
jgi:prepilin-type N-terminal cleavage/methylation domain-containing protein